MILLVLIVYFYRFLAIFYKSLYTTFNIIYIIKMILILQKVKENKGIFSEKMILSWKMETTIENIRFK